MLHAISISIVLVFSLALQAKTPTMEQMVSPVVRATQLIKAEDSEKSRFDYLTKLKDGLNSIHAGNIGRDKKSFDTRVFYNVMKPVLEMTSAKDCESTKHAVLLDDGGEKDVTENTQIALNLLNALCES